MDLILYATYKFSISCNPYVVMYFATSGPLLRICHQRLISLYELLYGTLWTEALTPLSGVCLFDSRARGDERSTFSVTTTTGPIVGKHIGRARLLSCFTLSHSSFEISWSSWTLDWERWRFGSNVTDRGVQSTDLKIRYRRDTSIRNVM